MFPRTSSAPRAAICVLLMACLAAAQRPDYEDLLSPKQKNRIFSWSTTAPMTEAINRLAPGAVRGTEIMQNHLAYVEAAILQAVSSRRPRREGDILQACNRVDNKWATQVTKQFGHRGFKDPPVTCITDVNGERMHHNDDPPYTLDELFEASLDRGDSIMANIHDIAGSFIDTTNNFTDPDFVYNVEYNTHYAECRLHPTPGFRSGPHWYIATAIHSKPKELAVFDTGTPQRNLVIEVHRVVGGQLNETLKMRLPVWRNDNLPKMKRNDTTTLIATSPRGGQPSHFGSIPVYENEAIVETLDRVDHPVQQAADALTPSSIAILVLPLCFNLVPIALFTDVGTLAFFAYAILTDVLTTIPLAIKGVELILIRANRHRTVIIRMSSAAGGDGTLPPASAASIWAAECRAKQEIGTAGVVLLVVSLVFLGLGIAVEILAKKYAGKKMKRWKLIHSELRRKISSLKTSTGTPSLSQSLEGPNSLGARNQDLAHLSYDGDFEKKKEDPP